MEPLKLGRARWSKWVVHALAWATFLFLPVLTDSSPEVHVLRLDRWSAFIAHATMTAMLMVFYYLNNLYLAPVLLLQGRKNRYILVVLACLVVYSGVTFSSQMWIRDLVLRSPIENAEVLSRIPWRLAPATIFFVVAGVLGTSQRISQAYVILLRDREAAENAHLEREIDQLRARMDPHFFFNALNTIYGLAELKDERTAKATLQLSALMRRTLEVPRTELVELSEEVEHLRAYIAFQELRSTAPPMKFTVQDLRPGARIAPLLLMPLVENAFKHGSSDPATGATQVMLTMAPNGVLNMRVANPLGHGTAAVSTGLGLANLKRRLNLEYPDAHYLEITKTDTEFRVLLSIELDHALHSS